MDEAIADVSTHDNDMIVRLTAAVIASPAD